MDIESNEIPVLELLQQASSQTPEVLQLAEAKLGEWETQPGFYSVLTKISTCATDVNVRMLATVCIKNGVDKYWAADAPNVISDEEKHNIRQELLSNFAEPVNQIAAQKAVLISKIARIDYPMQWSELFTVLLTAVENPDDVIQHRTLLTLHYVVKAFVFEIEPFHEITIKIYEFLLKMWNTYTAAFVRDMLQSASAQDISVNLEKSALTLKILTKLTVHGFYKPAEYEHYASFMNTAIEKTETGLKLRKQLQGIGGYAVELCEKFVVNITKALESVMKSHLYSFVGLIRPTLELTIHCLFSEEGTSLVFERFVIQCFNIIGEILRRFKSNRVERIRTRELSRAQEAIRWFFQSHIVLDVFRKMAGHYLTLTPAELDLWNSDAEEFSKDDSEIGWEYSLRPSVEKAFAVVFYEFKECLISFVQELVASTTVLVSPDDMQGILKKDAAYNAIALCSSELTADEININEWFAQTLLRDLMEKHANYKVIRRRAIILVGRWCQTLSSSETLRPVLYNCINSLLVREEDMAVKLAAASTLRRAVEFAPEHCDDQFKADLHTAFGLLFTTLEHSRECSTKMQILKVMTFMMERMANTAALPLGHIVHYIPCMWKEAEEHNMLRCAVVSSLAQIVQALREVKPEIQPLVRSILELGTDTLQNDTVYLLEYSLDLWLITLTHSPTATDHLVRLFHTMPTLLSYSLETVRKCLTVCLYQVVFVPELVMRTSGVQLVQVFSSLVSDLKNENDVTELMRVINTCIQASPVLGIQVMLPILPKIFEKMFSDDSKDLPWLMRETIHILARVLLSSQEIFLQIVSSLANSYNETELAMLGRLLDVWLDKAKHVRKKANKKLMGLALSSLLTTRSETVLARIGPIMYHIWRALSTINNVVACDGTVSESLVDFEIIVNTHETHHDRRLKLIISSDPIHRVILRDYVQSQLCELKNQLGVQQFHQVFQGVNECTMSRFKDYNILL